MQNLEEQHIVKVLKEGIVNERFNLYIGRWRESGKKHIGELATLEWATAAEYVEGPASLAMNATEAQVLMDSLWDSGIRPTDGSGSAGAMSATQNHLKDMQRLVFDVRIQKP